MSLQVLFQYLPEEDAGGKADAERLFLGIPARDLVNEADLSQAKMDLVLTLTGHHLAVNYMAELYDEVTMTRLLDSFVAMLQHAVQSPSHPALACSLLSTSDAQHIARFSCGAVRLDYADGPLAHEAFAAHAVSTPSAPCLVFEGSILSYAEAAGRVYALAHELQRRSVSAEMPVGVLLDRSLDLPLAFLAAMMAGSCYVPLDPSYPDDRLAGYMEDARAAVLVTQQQHAARARALGGEGASWQVGMSPCCCK